MPKSWEQFNTDQDITPGKEEKIAHFYENLERLGVDPGIRDTVAYLNVSGFHTTESCEGHLDHGTPAPRVGIEALGKPRWRFVNQKEIFENTAKEHGVTLEEIFEYVAPKYGITAENRASAENEDQVIQAWIEGWERTPKNEETEYFKLWRAKTDQLGQNLAALLQEFYQRRTVTENTRLVIERNSEDAHVYNFFLHNGGKDYALNLNPHELENLSKEEMDARKRDLAMYQQEMKDFTEFLKERFLEKEKGDISE